jgi:transcriptional regulator with XRE-family HTH domain
MWIDERAILLSQYIKTWRESHNISLRDFSKLANLSHNYLSILERAVNPGTNKPVNITMTTLQKIASATEVSLLQLLVRVGYICGKTNEVDHEFAAVVLEEEILNLKTKLKQINDISSI